MLYIPYAALLASLASVASASESSHVKLDFDVLKGDSRLSAQKGARASLVSKGDNILELANQLNFYSSTLKVGSNGDENTVLVDTGSSDLWVMASNVACYEAPNNKRSLEQVSPSAHHQVFGFQRAPLAPVAPVAPTKGFQKRDNSTSTTTTATTASQTLTRVDAATCTSLGSFNTGASDTFHFNSSAPPFSILYGDGSFANGLWGTDSVSVGPFDVSEISLAVVNDTTSDVGVFGIGLAALEVTYSDAYPQFAYKYQNFPVRLKDTGVINKVAYSLYLNDVDASTGSVLFGAVDHAKYSGQLQTVPIVNVYPQYFSKPISFNVVLDSITVEDSTQNITVTTDSLAALLDSGTTLTYLPKPIVDSLAASLNAKPSPFGYYEVDCSYNTSSAFATYNLSGVEIRVPLSDLIMSAAVAQSNDNKCYLGLVNSPNDQSTGAPTCILGDNFLRHAYIVYNLEDYEISLAQVKYTDSENIETISSTIPSAVKAPGYTNTALASAIGAQPSHGYLTLASSSSVVSSSYTTGVVASSGSASSVASSAVTSAVASSGVSSGVSSGIASSVIASSAVSWNTSYVSTSVSAPVAGTSLSGSLTTATNVVVSTSTDAAGSTVLVTNTYTTTYCPESSLAAASSSLTTATNVVVSTSTNAAGSTVLITNTYTTTYCPASAASAASASSAASAASAASALSSLTTATSVVVSTSTNAAGSTVLITNTYTTTYCPASASSASAASVASASGASGASSSTGSTTYVTVIQTVSNTSPASSASQTPVSPTTLVSVNSPAPVPSSVSTYVAGNSTVASSAPTPQTSSVTILQGGSSALSLMSAMLLVPFFALI